MSLASQQKAQWKEAVNSNVNMLLSQENDIQMGQPACEAKSVATPDRGAAIKPKYYAMAADMWMKGSRTKR